MQLLTDKVFSCNNRVKGHSDSTYKCMNAGFHITFDYDKPPSPIIGLSVIYICDACKTRYTPSELIAAQNQN